MFTALICAIAVSGCAAGAENSSARVSSTSAAAQTTNVLQTTKPTTTRTSAPPPVPELFEVTGQLPKNADLVGDNHVIAAFFDVDEVSTFTVSGKPLASTKLVKGEIVNVCDVLVLTRPDGTSLLLTQRFDTVPARGVEPEAKQAYLTARDTKNLETVWETRLISAPGYSNNCADRDQLRVTADGRWVTISGIGPDFEKFLVDTRDGKSRPLSYFPVAMGNRIATLSDLGNPDDITIRDPAGDNVFVSFPVNVSQSAVPGTLLFNATRTAYDWLWLPDMRHVVVYTGGAVAQAHFVDSESGVVTQTVDLPASDRFGGPFSYGAEFQLDEEADRFYVAPPRVPCPNGCQLVAYQLSTMTEAWRLDGVERICTADGGQLAIEINNQVAVLDAKDGAQVDYASDQRSCGVVFGSYGVDRSTGSVRLLVGGR